MLKSPTVSKQQERWWGFRPEEKSFNCWLSPITFPNSFPHLLEHLYASATCPGRFLCRNWMELLNPGSKWFHGYCKYHRWDAGLFNANVSFVNDLLRSGFHLCLHMCWTFSWWYSEGGKEFDCLSEMVLNGSQTDPVLHLDSISQGTIWNKTLRYFFYFNENQKSWKPSHVTVSYEGRAGNSMFSQLKQVIRFSTCYYISGLLWVIMQTLSKVCCKASWAHTFKSPCKSACHSFKRNKTRLKAPVFSLKTHMAVVAVLAYVG